jgi:predicted DNA-binding transcriptional regulator AlpA
MKRHVLLEANILDSGRRAHAFNAKEVLYGTSLRARQFAKIRQLKQALIASGYHGLDDQAKALGLSRSTTWTILRASHKNSGLSAAIINRMLSTPELPSSVRLRLYEYVEEKKAGLYGDERTRLQKFAARIQIGDDGLNEEA